MEVEQMTNEELAQHLRSVYGSFSMSHPHFANPAYIEAANRIRTIETLQARVRELESLVETMEYKLEWYGEKEQQPQALKGGE